MAHAWKYIKKTPAGDKEIGPISEHDFVELINKLAITNATMVRCPKRTKGRWVAAGKVPAISQLIDNAAPALTATKKRPVPVPNKVPSEEPLDGRVLIVISLVISVMCSNVRSRHRSNCCLYRDIYRRNILPCRSDSLGCLRESIAPIQPQNDEIIKQLKKIADNGRPWAYDNAPCDHLMLVVDVRLRE